MIITYAIIDDEPIAHRIIEGYCGELPHLKKMGNAFDVFEAAEIMATYKTDLIFLDINMPKMSGFEWLKTLSKPPKIIVTSAYREFALEGYELNIVDYLLKPFSLARFLKAMHKIELPQKNSVGSIAHSPEGSKSFFLKGDKTYHQIHAEDILFIEAYGNYVKVFLMDDMKVSHQKISNLEALLSKTGFTRVHKSFLVAINKIERIEGNRIFMKNHKIPIGQTYRNDINKLLNS